MSISPSPDQQTRASERSARLLAIGAALGLALAAYGLLGEAASSGLPTDAIARVNGTVLRADDFERLVVAVLEDMRTPDEEKARKRVLDRMIEEELLIQRALDLGLVHLDRKVRADLTSSMITSVVADIKDLSPSEEQLEAFYAENRDYFVRPGRVLARQIFFRVTNNRGAEHPLGTAEERAGVAHQRLLAGDAYEDVKRDLGDFEISPIPAAMLPASKLRQYTGPTLLRSISELEVGAWTKPVRSGMGFHVAQLVDRDLPESPPLDEIREQVAVDWRRRAGDRALRDYLDELRARADIEIAEGFH
ncbi:MAG: hypothetical protein GY944_07260 [bacterium]|nr:hypothetical protein [bacterium]